MLCLCESQNKKRGGFSNSTCTHSTPRMNLKSCNGSLCIDMLFAADQYVMLGLHVFTEMKLSFAVKQKECGFYFSILHHVMVVHTI